LAVFRSQHQHLIGLVASVSIIHQLLVLQAISGPQFAKMACGYRAVMALLSNHKTTMRLKERHVTVANQQMPVSVGMPLHKPAWGNFYSENGNS
jgi:hypothetical protein